MPSQPATADRAEWEALLMRRDHPKWSSLSWLALRPLISAANDRINTYAPELVGDLRQAWVARQQADGRWPAVTAADGRVYHGVVDRRAASAFVVLGDTGEQDASQYAVVPELRRAAATLGDGGFALICSDVIYPSGDVNDYAHALYLPYGPRPDGPGLADDPLARLDVLALPGNHDWYDGLAGFMFHFCGRDRLPRSVYGWRQGISRKEALARLVWRRPSRPLPARLWAPLRGTGGRGPDGGSADEASDGTGDARRTALRDLSELRRERGLGNLQPGPYYAVELRDVLVVCIDTGIARNGRTELDADQSTWLVDVSRHPKPKLLFTGSPLRVDLVWKPCPLSGPAADGHADVHAVVRDPAHRYVAAAGGDIHNYQHYAPEPGTGIHYVVSGGGGAFLSATHPLALIGDPPAAPPPAPVAPDVGGPAADPAAAPSPASTVAPGSATVSGGADLSLDGLYPSAVDSLKRFGRILLVRLWRFQRALLALVAGLLAAVLATPLTVAGPGVDAGRPTAALTATAVAVGGAVAVRFLAPLPPGATRSRPYRAAVVILAFALGALLGTGLWWLDPGRARWNTVGWAGLTAGGSLLAHLMRETSWWRTARASDPALRWWILPVAVVAWCSAAAVAVAVDAWVTVAALVALAAAALVGWRERAARGRRGQPWNATAARLAYGVQGAVALAAVSEVVLRPSTAWYPSAVVGGLLLAGFGALVGLVLSALVIAGLGRLAAPVLRRRGDETVTWREVYGVLGFLGPWLTALLAVGGPIAALAVATARRPDHPGWGGVLLAAAAISSGTVGSVILLDTLRRSFPRRYKLVNAGVVAASVGALVGLFHGTWALSGLLAALVVVVLGAVTAVVVNLTFLRTWALFVDPQVHGDGIAEVFTDEQAAEVLEWRHSADDAKAPTSAVIRRRGRIVFPSAYQPRGPIQAKVSEFFDDDNPPFAKNFLVVRTDGQGVTIEARPVDGLRPLPPIETIRLRFPAG